MLPRPPSTVLAANFHDGSRPGRLELHHDNAGRLIQQIDARNNKLIFYTTTSWRLSAKDSRRLDCNFCYDAYHDSSLDISGWASSIRRRHCWSFRARGFAKSRDGRGVIARKVAQVTITNAVRKRAGQAILQDVTDQVAAKLRTCRKSRAAKTVLSRPEYWLAQRLPWFAKMKYGKAVEMLAARDIEKTPGLDSLFKHLGGPEARLRGGWRALRA